MCRCKDNPFCDSHHGHVVTGDPNFFTNRKFRSLITKGPSYREASKIDWNIVYSMIKYGVESCTPFWSKHANVDSRLLQDWENTVLQKVKDRIEELRSNSKKYRFPGKILQDKKVKKYLQELHEHYVIVPTDKASNNFSVICKNFYVETLLQELSIIQDYKEDIDDDETKESKHKEEDIDDEETKKYKHNDKNTETETRMNDEPTTNQQTPEKTYNKEIETKTEDIINIHTDYMIKHKIWPTIPKNSNDPAHIEALEKLEKLKKLPFLYWIPKMH